jgi:hypothetical protein
MRLSRWPPASPLLETDYVGDHADHVGHVRPITPDEDGRPSRADREDSSIRTDVARTPGIASATCNTGPQTAHEGLANGA